MPTLWLFVYGTLQRGQRSHQLLEGQQFIGPARTEQRYRLLDVGSYPGLVEDATRGVAVHGELWQIDATLLPRLDEYEGSPTLFVRRPVALQAAPAGPVVAYFYNGRTDLPDCGPSWPPFDRAETGRYSTES